MKEGIVVKFKCIVIVELVFSFEWFKDGVRVKESRRVKVESDGVIVLLCFKEIRLDDKGEYKCVVSNDFGFVFCIVSLNVLVVIKLDFKEKMKVVEVIEGDIVIFNVFVVGYFEFSVEWFRGIIKLMNDE